MTLSNRQPMLDKLNEQLRELGRESVKSTLAKPQMALAVIRAARAALINQDDCCFSRRTEPGFPSRSEPPLIMDVGSG